MNPSADVLALASAEFDVASVPEGNTITVKWRGKPIFIRHRTAAEIAKEAEVDITTLRDPETDASRAADPAW
jgi:ubiquinol-cytochrome c reductase iron-sulfur subunit